MGVTQRALIDYLGIPVSVSDVKNLTRKEAVEFYYRKYIEDPKLEKYLRDEWLLEYVFDMFVNHGARNASRILQRAACVVDDGIIGPITAGAANRADPAILKRALDRERSSFFVDIVLNDNSQLVFLKGWINRVYDVA